MASNFFHGSERGSRSWVLLCLFWSTRLANNRKFEYFYAWVLLLWPGFSIKKWDKTWVVAFTISLPVIVQAVNPVFKNFSPATVLNIQPVIISSFIIYSKTKLQKLLRICIHTKRSSKNEHSYNLKTCFSNEYFSKFYLDCYQFCQ